MPDESELAGLRRSYEVSSLDEKSLADNPLAQLHVWLDDALAAAVPEPNAMTLATVGDDQRPSARTVLLKGLDDRGLMFATNLQSTKGQQLIANPAVAAVFLWHQLSRQVCVQGRAELAPSTDSDAYFASRPREHQLGAWASHQSSVIASSDEVKRAYAQAEQDYPTGVHVPRPPHWGCVIIVPESVEFWQGQPSRLHDRLRFVRVGVGGLGDSSAWHLERLAP